MKCVCITLILMLFLPAAWAKHGTCMGKLAGHGVPEENTEFTMYLELLLEERVITVGDLGPFIQGLNENKVINPIPTLASNKNYAFHHVEFQSLIETGAFEMEQVKTWVNGYVAKTTVTQAQVEKTKLITEEVPYIAEDGSVFYKVKHPTMGLVYRILKPGGRTENPNDWYPKVWPVSLLTDDQGQILKLSNQGSSVLKNTLRRLTGIGPDARKAKNLSPRDSPARKACLDKGDKTDLPTLNDFLELMSHFRHKPEGDGLITLTDSGREEFYKMFPQSELFNLWTASPLTGEMSSQTLVFQPFVGMITYIGSKENAAVLCVGTL